MGRNSILLASALLLLTAIRAGHATDYPWCGYGGEVGTPVCAYATFEQCRMSARSCAENPRQSQQASRPANAAPRRHGRTAR
jgi:hypothetical protein